MKERLYSLDELLPAGLRSPMGTVRFSGESVGEPSDSGNDFGEPMPGPGPIVEVPMDGTGPTPPVPPMPGRALPVATNYASGNVFLSGDAGFVLDGVARGGQAWDFASLEAVRANEDGVPIVGDSNRQDPEDRAAERTPVFKDGDYAGENPWHDMGVPPCPPPKDWDRILVQDKSGEWIWVWRCVTEPTWVTRGYLDPYETLRYAVIEENPGSGGTDKPDTPSGVPPANPPEEGLACECFSECLGGSHCDIHIEGPLFPYNTFEGSHSPVRYLVRPYIEVELATGRSRHMVRLKSLQGHVELHKVVTLPNGRETEESQKLDEPELWQCPAKARYRVSLSEAGKQNVNSLLNHALSNPPHWHLDTIEVYKDDVLCKNPIDIGVTVECTDYAITRLRMESKTRQGNALADLQDKITSAEGLASAPIHNGGSSKSIGQHVVAVMQLMFGGDLKVSRIVSLPDCCCVYVSGPDPDNKPELYWVVTFPEPRSDREKEKNRAAWETIKNIPPEVFAHVFFGSQMKELKALIKKIIADAIDGLPECGKVFSDFDCSEGKIEIGPVELMSRALSGEDVLALLRYGNTLKEKELPVCSDPNHDVWVVSVRDSYKKVPADTPGSKFPNPFSRVHVYPRVEGAPSGADLAAHLECCDPCCYLVWINGFATPHEPDKPNALEHAWRVNRFLSQAFKEKLGRPGKYCKTILFSVPLNLCESSVWKDAIVQGCFGEMEDLATRIGKNELAEFLKALRTKCPYSSINIVSWSLGGRVALSALKGLAPGTINTAILAHPAVERDVLESNEEFDIDKLSGVRRLVIAHSREDKVLGSMFDYAASLTTDALGEEGSSFTRTWPWPSVENWDMTDIWGQSHNGVIGGWGSDTDGLGAVDAKLPMGNQDEAKRFWEKVAQALTFDVSSCDLPLPLKRTLEPPHKLGEGQSIAPHPLTDIEAS